MARIDGIIILDPNGKPLITSHFPSHPPSYPSVHIDAFNHAARKAKQNNEELEAVLWVNVMGNGGIMGAGLCHMEREGLKFLVPVGQEVNPLFAFSFLETFLDTLTDYLGEVTETMIKDNFDIVYMLIEEMLDEGHPMTMESAMLKEIVLPPSLMRKLLNAAGMSGIQAHTTTPFTAPIPWRRQGVRHTNNEIYFDIVESLDAIIDRRGNVLSSDVWGSINCNSKLSGNPDLLLTLGNGKVMTNCSFHPCIRYNKWSRDGVLSFIPPDGRFKLLEYQGASGRREMPFALRAGMTVEEHGGKFSLTLSSRTNHRPLEDVVVSIYLGSATTSVSATATGDRRPMGIHTGPLGAGVKRDDALSEGFVGGGTWEFDPNTQLLRWTISSLISSEKPATLTGSFTSTDMQPVPSPSFDVSFSISQYLYTTLKVDQLKVQGDVMYKPFKGVRMVAKSGKIEVRW